VRTPFAGFGEPDAAAAGARLLPACASDNFVSMLPCETRRITIERPAVAAGGLRVELKGWSVREIVIPARPARRANRPGRKFDE
jgi:hypothetical protein